MFSLYVEFSVKTIWIYPRDLTWCVARWPDQRAPCWLLAAETLSSGGRAAQPSLGSAWRPHLSPPADLHLMMDPGQESTQPASHYWQSRLDNQSDCVAHSSDLSSDKTPRQLSDCDVKFAEEDSIKLQASSSSSSSSSRLFNFYDSSLQSPERRHFQERNSPRKGLYDEHSSSPDNCQTSQVRIKSDL